MNKRLLGLLLALAMLLTLTACGQTESASSDVPDAQEASGAEESSTTEGSEETEEPQEGAYTLFMDGGVGVNADGESFVEIPFAEEGEEYVLPEADYFTCEGHEFACWEYNTELYQPGDTVALTDWGMLSAIWMPTDGSVVIFKDGTDSLSCCTLYADSEPVLAEDLLDGTSASDSMDRWQEGWTDADGNFYEVGEEITLEAGQMLILNSVWNDDISLAYKVTTNHNLPDTGDDNIGFEEEFYRYIKPGRSVTVWAVVSTEGYELVGWYDAPEGGNLICQDGDTVTPEGDLTLYAQWQAIE